MSFAESVPEDARNLRPTPQTIEQCLCRWEWVADPDDLADATTFRRYLRSYPVITFAATCPVMAHQAKAGTQSHFNHWRDP